MTAAGSVAGDGTLRLFLALRLPSAAVVLAADWARRELHGCRLVPEDNMHVTLAFLGAQPRAALGPIVGALEGASRSCGPIAFEVARWRETRSVGMLVLSDRDRAAAALAADVHGRLEALGVYRRERRPWLAHLTVCRFRVPPRLAPPLPDMGTCVPSDAAAYLSHLHPSGARYEVIATAPLGTDFDETRPEERRDDESR